MSPNFSSNRTISAGLQKSDEIWTFASSITVLEKKPVKKNRAIYLLLILTLILERVDYYENIENL